MPTLFTIFGLRFFFFSEEHLPVHVHVEKENARAKFIVLPEVKLVENKGLKPKDLKKATEIVKLYQEEIVEKWKEYHGE